jgi:NhaA family Na+:H+ antiporter
VLVGLCVPSRAGGTREEALARADAVLDSVRGAGGDDGALHAIESHVDRAQSPLENLEHGLHPYVAFAILPLFAFANAGIPLGGMGLGDLVHPTTLGIALGLLIGKPVGILSASWLAVRSGLAELPGGVGWRHLLGAGFLGGIGFTMSLFIAALAFPDSEGLHTAAKLGILLGSAVAAVVGLAILAGSPSTAEPLSDG